MTNSVYDRHVAYQQDNALYDHSSFDAVVQTCLAQLLHLASFGCFSSLCERVSCSVTSSRQSFWVCRIKTTLASPINWKETPQISRAERGVFTNQVKGRPSNAFRKILNSCTLFSPNPGKRSGAMYYRSFNKPFVADQYELLAACS